MERIEGDDPSDKWIESLRPSKYALRFIFVILNQTSFP